MLAEGIKQLRDKNVIDARLLTGAKTYTLSEILLHTRTVTADQSLGKTQKTCKRSFMPSLSTSTILRTGIRSLKIGKPRGQVRRKKPRLINRAYLTCSILASATHITLLRHLRRRQFPSNIFHKFL